MNCHANPRIAYDPRPISAAISRFRFAESGVCSLPRERVEYLPMVVDIVVDQLQDPLATLALRGGQILVGGDRHVGLGVAVVPIAVLAVVLLVGHAPI